MTESVVVVVAGGEAPSPGPAFALPQDATVVAADGGLVHAHALGLEVAVVVGDFDSAPPESVRAAERAGARVERHPEGKDATDLELALETALSFAPTRILVLAGVAGRLDHLFSMLQTLASPRFADVEIDAAIGPARAHVIRGERRLEGSEGELLSLFALHGLAEGVSTEGLAYPLDRETLEPGSSRGVSNAFTGNDARVSLERGTLLAIVPGPEEALS